MTATHTHSPGPFEAGEPAWFRGRTDPDAGKIPITAGAHGVIANVYGRGNAELFKDAPAAATVVPDGLIAKLQDWWQTDDDGDMCRVDSAAVNKAIAILQSLQGAGHGQG